MVVFESEVVRIVHDRCEELPLLLTEVIIEVLVHGWKFARAGDERESRIVEDIVVNELGDVSSLIEREENAEHSGTIFRDVSGRYVVFLRLKHGIAEAAHKRIIVAF